MVLVWVHHSGFYEKKEPVFDVCYYAGFEPSLRIP